MQIRKYLGLAALCFLSAGLFAQNNSKRRLDNYRDTLHFYFKLNGGYAWPVAPGNLNGFLPFGSYSDNVINGFYNITTTYYPQSITNDYSNINLSLGKGAGLYASLGYVINKHLSAELGGGYLWGATYTAHETTIDNTMNMAMPENGTHYRQLSARAWMLDAALVIKAQEKKWTPYLRLGLLMALPTIYYHEYIKGIPACNPPYNTLDWKFYGGFGLGGTASGGVTYKLNHKFELFGEARINAFSYAPLKGRMTNYNVKGVNKVDSFPAEQTHVSYYDHINWSSSSVYASPPDRQLKTHFPFSSWGVNLGLKFNFAHVYYRKPRRAKAGDI